MQHSPAILFKIHDRLTPIMWTEFTEFPAFFRRISCRQIKRGPTPYRLRLRMGIDTLLRVTGAFPAQN